MNGIYCFISKINIINSGVIFNVGVRQLVQRILSGRSKQLTIKCSISDPDQTTSDTSM